MHIKALLQTAVGKYKSKKPNGSNGALGLAKEVLHISNGSLSRKVNPNDDGSHCSPQEVLTICRETGDHAPLQAMALDLGYVLMPLQAGIASDMAPSLAGNFKELGEWLQAASAAASTPASALTDNVITSLQRELFEGIFTSMQTFNEIKAKHEAAKPGLRAVA